MDHNLNGHRQRFNDGYGIGLKNYEILKLLLTYSIPRKDVKPIAKQLIDRFNSLNGVLDASAEELSQTKTGKPYRFEEILTGFQLTFCSV